MLDPHLNPYLAPIYEWFFKNEDLLEKQDLVGDDDYEIVDIEIEAS